MQLTLDGVFAARGQPSRRAGACPPNATPEERRGKFTIRDHTPSRLADATNNRICEYTPYKHRTGCRCGASDSRGSVDLRTAGGQSRGKRPPHHLTGRFSLSRPF